MALRELLRAQPLLTATSFTDVQRQFHLIAYALAAQELVIAGRAHRLAEFEFYFTGGTHLDPFTHRDPRQRTCGKWYFHRTGGSYRGGTYKGLDLTFGDASAFGGIIIRAIEECESGALVDGPCLVVNHILTLTGHDSVADLVGTGFAGHDPDALPALVDDADALPLFLRPATLAATGSAAGLPVAAAAAAAATAAPKLKRTITSMFKASAKRQRTSAAPSAADVTEAAAHAEEATAAAAASAGASADARGAAPRGGLAAVQPGADAAAAVSAEVMADAHGSPGGAQSPYLTSARVGLSLKRAVAGHEHFLLQPYRFLLKRALPKLKKGRTYVMCAEILRAYDRDHTPSAAAAAQLVATALQWPRKGIDQLATVIDKGMEQARHAGVAPATSVDAAAAKALPVAAAEPMPLAGTRYGKALSNADIALLYGMLHVALVLMLE